MKRKVFEESLYFPSKSRRLDDGLIQTVVEEPRSMENEMVATTALEKASETETAERARALVLYNPASTPFLTSPTSPDFKFILNSDLVPGLKDLIFWPENSNKLKPVEDTDDSLAVVPWVGSQFLQASPESPSQSEPMESEEVEMMDTENSSGTVEANEGPQFWKQHCTSPQNIHNRFTHVPW